MGLYVSPDRDLVISFFSTTPDTGSIQRYLRPLVMSGLFDEEGVMREKAGASEANSAE